MIRNEVHSNIATVTRRLAVGCLLLLALVGSSFAQGSDQQFVIKKKNTDHYLAHVYNETEQRWEVQDTTAFSPSCLWYSGRTFNIAGTNHNYYFFDGTNYRFLSASFVPNAPLTLSASLPKTFQLNNSDTLYYFYDWDYDHKSSSGANIEGAGVARGHKFAEVDNSSDCNECHANWNSDDNECWRVYWAEVKEDPANPGSYKWEMSSNYSYNITANSGRFRMVTTTPHEWEITSGEGTGLGAVTVASGTNLNYNDTRALSVAIADFSYRPRYTTYEFDEITASTPQNDPVPTGNIEHHTYHYCGNTSGVPAPVAYDVDAENAVAYEWTLSGPGAEYLSFNDATLATPTLTYNTVNNEGHKTATVTVTVTYSNGYTQSSSVNVMVLTSCQNPGQAAAPVITYEDVTVSWFPTADSYVVYWKKDGTDWSTASSASVAGNVTSYPITGLEYGVTYNYKVAAVCGGGTPQDVPNHLVFSFTMKAAPNALVYGCVFGGGRMANVGGKTEVVIINCDSIGAVYGGNDIFGSVVDAEGSTIVLGVDASDDPASYSHLYNDGAVSTKVRIRDVYGGGNGYYLYNDAASFVGASSASVTIENGKHVKDLQGNTVYTNTSGDAETKTIPTIVKTAITVTNNAVKVDSIFGGAKNAFITNTVTDANGTSITVDGGTAFAVFGGNNYGGNQTAGKHYIGVNSTTIDLTPGVESSATTGYGRDFGIRYLFGGGNKVAGLTTDIVINGGQCDTVFAGGNAADVAEANVLVSCALEAGSNQTFGKTYTNAISSYDGTDLVIKDFRDYTWTDTMGVYNVRTLFGGNNRADMTGLPSIILSSGSVGTVYGGGNAGNMLDSVPDTSHNISVDFGSPTVGSEAKMIAYSTHVVMNTANMLVDNLYGGCQMSDVKYSTWVEVENGHVGNVFGGCNISGDVGSTPIFGYSSNMPGDKYQYVRGGTYVKVSGGTVYKNLYAGSNGYYHCNDGVYFVDGIINLGHYIGLTIPTHNETHVMLTGDDTKVKGNVYAGGNVAPVGFIRETDQNYRFRDFVGYASVRMSGGTVDGDVYGGGNMASIYGSNEVFVSGGTIHGALYGGNDQCGLVAQITDRVLPSDYDVASDPRINLTAMGVHTYVGIEGKPQINTVYGGGNGAYDYTPENYCNPNDHPVQSNTFVDINIDAEGGENIGGRINTVYGGGNGVTVTGGTTILVNVENAGENTYPHVGVIFGGNNMGDLAILPDLIMLSGRVDTIYGGCNAGAMVGRHTVEGLSDVGSRVILRDTYTPVGSTTPIALSGVVSGAVYGGCRMNNVDYNTLVLVEAGNHGSASFFGGCDISGSVNESYVKVTGGQVGNVYGGGNGNYYYEGNKVYDISDHSVFVDSIASGTITAPVCAVSRVDILGGQVGASGDGNEKEVFGGGYGAGTRTTGNVTVNVGNADAASALATPIIYGNIYGGSALGSVNTSSSHLTQVNFLNGTLHGNVFGGGLGDAEDATKGKTYGQVEVNISNSTQAVDNCFIDLRDANVYGCNNTNGSPQDNVTVNVYKTAHTATDLASYTESDATFAINNVFGGGKLASYSPSSDAKKAAVNVYGCDNTIRRVFGGGDAASARGVVTNIPGGRFYQVFGGGNGEVSAADIGDGGINLAVSGGTIYQLFGGNNTSGDIGGPMTVTVTNDGTCNEDITEFFGGSNAAKMGTTTPVTLTTTISCSTPPVNIATVYGGSNLADITGDVTLTIEGGTFTEVYAGSKGASGESGAADIIGTTTLNLYGGTITNAFGGSNVNGNITGLIQVNMEDQGSCDLHVDNVYGGGNNAAYTPTFTPSSGTLRISPEVNIIHGTVNNAVYGGGKGSTATVTANPIVTIGDNNTSHKVVIGANLNGTSTLGAGNVYGGGDAAAVNGSTTVIYQDSHADSQVNKLFGGGNQAGIANTASDATGNATVNMNSGKVLTGIYGGCNDSGTVTGDIVLNVTGGTIGASTSARANIHGGGYGHDTHTSGDVTVNIGATNGQTPPTYSGTAVINGEVYGGSALGQVSASDKTTTVNFYKGTINGDVYGGGLGNNDYAAEVSGDVEVNIYGGVFNDADGNANTYNPITGYSGGGCIYGCNNANGSPKGDVNVNIYATDHTSIPQDNYYPTTPEGGWNVTTLATNAASQTYAINAVFGGGNLAAYHPAAAGDPHKATVHVYNCNNTIKDVFGGGNAADVGDGTVAGSITLPANTYVYIEGGRIHRVIGGGNGESGTAANIFGTANTTVYAGLIDEVYGGANMNGSVDAINLIMSNPNNSSLSNCTDQVYGKVFGCANAAPYNKSVTTTILCGVGEIGQVYGGSNQAYIGDPSNHNSGVSVTLNLYGGNFTNVFAGSKGIADIPGTPGVAADIYGDVTLNLYGGTVEHAFGGSDANGNITGDITVNVLDFEGTCGLNVTNIYGASNLTPYEPDNVASGPVINVMHIKQDAGISGNVYGGGNQAPVTSNPQVNIGYDAATMSDIVAATSITYPSTSTFYTVAPRAYVTGNVFGGGNEAGVTGDPVINMRNGTVHTDIYGGCNSSGTVTGNIAVNLTGGTVENDVFGGGQGVSTATDGGILVTVDGSTISGDVYGGSALGQVNSTSSQLTKTWLKSGSITGNLYGGGMGQVGAGYVTYGQVNGQVEVLVNGGSVNNVFGCNNTNGGPQSSVKVYINETGTLNVSGNVYGGGNVAYCESTCEVYLQNGTINNKVFGGGNNISVADKGVGGSNVQMTGGTVLGGIYGGCYTDGDVTGNSVVTITGGTIGADDTRTSIHGGGYGQLTKVAGDVTVTFGALSVHHNDFPKLYGDLYGGSALGSVNTNGSNTTTVNVLNGIITGVGEGVANYGNVFGGGLGTAEYPAVVNGVVYVNIGNSSGGQASLTHCNVFGCNNQKGSPQDDVYVSVYETTHTLQDGANYFNDDLSYAIYQVFGGGNEAHYAPENNNASSAKKAHVHIYNCDNTAKYVYGGGNAANAVGVVTIVEGGRFMEIYGGGNGRVTPANITGLYGIGLNVVAGNVGFLFEGSNKEGVNASGIYYKPDASSDCLGGLFVDSYFFGTNEAELYGDLNNIITCEDAGSFEYRYVFAGSRWGIVYGDISLTVCGGTIENLFGGCRGEDRYTADVRRFPTFAELYTDYQLPEAQRKYSDALRSYMGFDPNTYDPANPTAGQPSFADHGGNINLVITGGTIGNVFGGCDYLGNVEGKISVTVCDAESASCPLFIGNVYGASNQCVHEPESTIVSSPEVKILKGTIGGTHQELPVNNIYGASATEYEGNVFGGGNYGNVTSNPLVIIGDGPSARVNVKGDVYGGGNEGDIIGSPNVIVVPQRYAFTFNAQAGGSVTVKDGHGGDVASGDEIGEGIDLSLTAMPDDYAHRFTGWILNSGTGASIVNTSAASTTFTMGTGPASVTASFGAVASNALTFNASPTGGTFTVTGSNGNVTSGTSIGVGVQLSLAATPSPYGYKFKKWTVTGGASVANENAAATTFTMGSDAATIAAEFETVSKFALTINTASNGTFTVKDYQDNNVASGTEIGVGAVLYLVATPASGYAFTGWTVTGAGSSVANPSNPTTTFTMGTAAASITANFASTHPLTITSPTHGSIRVTNSLGQEVNSGDGIGVGATLNLKATPISGYAFSTWTVSGEGAAIANLSNPITSFTMGTDNATIGATFITAHILTVIEPEQIENSDDKQGVVKVTTSLGQTIAGSTSVGEGAVLTIEATATDGYQFTGWECTGGTVDTSVIPNTFTMGTTDATIKANFVQRP